MNTTKCQHRPSVPIETAQFHAQKTMLWNLSSTTLQAKQHDQYIMVYIYMPFEPSSSHICRPANGEACFKSFQHESFPASDRRKAPATKTREAQTTTRVRKVEMAALENPTLDQAGGGQHATCSCVQPKSGEVPTKKKKTRCRVMG